MVLSFSVFIYRIPCISGLWICLSSEIPQWYYFDGKLAQVHIHSWKIKCWDFVISFLGNLLSWHTVSLYFNPYIPRFFYSMPLYLFFDILSAMTNIFITCSWHLPVFILGLFYEFYLIFFFLIVAFIYRIIIHNNFSWSDAKCDSARFHKSKMKKKVRWRKKH